MRILLITFVIPILIEGWVNFPQVQKDPLGGIETTGNGRGRVLSRAKRNAMQFALMIWCETKRYPMAYNGYGCHCGIGGKGAPLDEIDRCCLIHDKCYDNIIDNKICGSLKSAVYLTFYWRSGCSSCALFNSTCQKALCECDGEAARCFKRNEFAFHSRSRNYDKSLCK